MPKQNTLNFFSFFSTSVPIFTQLKSQSFENIYVQKYAIKRNSENIGKQHFPTRSNWFIFVPADFENQE